MSVGENVRRLRKEAGLSQSELARLVEVSTPMICQIERGTKSPSFQLGMLLASALNCSPDELAGDARPG